MANKPRPVDPRPQQSDAAHAGWARCEDRLSRLANAHSARDRMIAAKYGIPAELQHSNPAEYEKRLGNAKRAYFGGLARKSVTARRKAKQLEAQAAAAEAELADAEEVA